MTHAFWPPLYNFKVTSSIPLSAIDLFAEQQLVGLKFNLAILDCSHNIEFQKTSTRAYMSLSLEFILFRILMENLHMVLNRLIDRMS